MTRYSAKKVSQIAKRIGVRHKCDALIAELYKKEEPQVTITITRNELWDMISGSFDKADGTDFDDPEQDYHDYYWCVTDDLFKQMQEEKADEE